MTPKFDPTLPFVLLDDARAGTARLFTDLSGTVQAERAEQVVPALAALRAIGGERAGFIGFEAGYALEPRLLPLFRAPDDGLPLLWFGRFDRVRRLDADAIDALLDAGPAELAPPIPSVERPAYDRMLARIAALIEAGDIYQANATFAATVATHGHPLALYRRLRAAQAARYGALIHTGRRWILSLSPELFFKLEGRALTTRPMKGTAARGVNAAADDAAAATLAADPKNRAENLMIVDLLRNDLSRVAVPGSVATPALFEVERYPTVLQMTSTVTAVARSGIDAVDVLAALFPCGSVTGAPKLRAMEVIAEVEAGPRGLYTGSIGWLGADGDASFNVAIRTLVMQAGGGARLGLGSGIVADSVADAEWAECIGKAAFLTRRAGSVDLIETMRCEHGVIAHRDRHLDRLMASAAFLGHQVDRAAADALLDAVAPGLDTGAARVRLLASKTGALAVQASPLPAAPTGPVEVTIVPLPVPSSDWRLSHKTSDRAFYDDARHAAGTFDVVFVRPDGRITEGSFTNVFVQRDGRLLTPPLADGLLPGILRATLIAEGRAVEALLTAEDLESGFLVGNVLRGLIPAKISLPRFVSHPVVSPLPVARKRRA
jgi:para-aminobenzoate synthetase/4-amino-4-deoxychorismate lyase